MALLASNPGGLGVLLFFALVFGGLCPLIGILMIVAAMHQPRPDTASGKIAVGMALMIFGLVAAVCFIFAGF